MNSDKNEPYTRKDFLRTAGSTLLFASLGIGLTSCGNVTDSVDSNTPDIDTSDPDSPITIDGNTITLDLSHMDLENLKSEGGWVLIRDANTLVVNVDGETIRAFTSVCTHAGHNCSTNWVFNGELFTCRCHNSKFNTSGGVVDGPATRNLQEFSTMLEDNILTITK